MQNVNRLQNYDIAQFTLGVLYLSSFFIPWYLIYRGPDRLLVQGEALVRLKQYTLLPFEYAWFPEQYNEYCSQFFVLGSIFAIILFSLNVFYFVVMNPQFITKNVLSKKSYILGFFWGIVSYFMSSTFLYGANLNIISGISLLNIEFCAVVGLKCCSVIFFSRLISAFWILVAQPRLIYILK